MIHRLSIIASGGVFAGGLLAFAHTISKKKAISERYTIKTASRLLQNDIATVEHKDRSSYKME
jgi:hypothetical protein